MYKQNNCPYLAETKIKIQHKHTKSKPIHTYLSQLSFVPLNQKLNASQVEDIYKPEFWCKVIMAVWQNVDAIFHNATWLYLYMYQLLLFSCGRIGSKPFFRTELLNCVNNTCILGKLLKAQGIQTTLGCKICLS